MVKRVRLDDDAGRKLDELSENYDGSQKGLASELIRIGYKQWKEQSKNGTND